AASSYSIYRGTSAGGESTTAIATGVTATSYTDTTAANGTTYYYIVKAINAGGASAASNEVSATPRAPVSLVLAIDAGGGAAETYVADIDAIGGATAIHANPINISNVVNPAPDAVYQSERYGNFSYAIPNLTAGASYTVRLHFAEIYWSQAGQRVFN